MHGPRLDPLCTIALHEMMPCAAVRCSWAFPFAGRPLSGEKGDPGLLLTFTGAAGTICFATNWHCCAELWCACDTADTSHSTFLAWAVLRHVVMSACHSACCSAPHPLSPCLQSDPYPSSGQYQYTSHGSHSPHDLHSTPGPGPWGCSSAVRNHLGMR